MEQIAQQLLQNGPTGLHQRALAWNVVSEHLAEHGLPRPQLSAGAAGVELETEVGSTDNKVRITSRNVNVTYDELDPHSVKKTTIVEVVPEPVGILRGEQNFRNPVESWSDVGRLLGTAQHAAGGDLPAAVPGGSGLRRPPVGGQDGRRGPEDPPGNSICT